MRLNDPLVNTFEFNEVEYTIDLAFDNVLDVFDVIANKELFPKDRAEISLKLLIAEDIESDHVIDLWNYIFEKFIRTETKQIIEYDRNGDPVIFEEEDKGKLMDLEQDSEFIFSSFQQAYGINLRKVQGELQWREFQALLNGLPSNTIMKRIIEIRAYEPSKHDSSEYKQNMEKLKRKFAIHDVEGEEEE